LLDKIRQFAGRNGIAAYIGSDDPGCQLQLPLLIARTRFAQSRLLCLLSLSPVRSKCRYFGRKEGGGRLFLRDFRGVSSSADLIRIASACLGFYPDAWTAPAGALKLDDTGGRVQLL
jgi:hypothetical protein